MTRSLFLGDSHSHGYAEVNGEVQFWKDNNYAELYSDHNNKPVAIYSIPGGCNKKYPTWLKAMLDYYDDIDEVFIQATYWNRYLIACSRNLDVGDGIKANHFSKESDKTTLYVATLKGRSLHKLVIDDEMNILKHSILPFGERIRDIIFSKELNKILLFFESSATLATLEII